jgi:hypothetical protein
VWSVLGVPAGQPPGEWHRTSCLLSSGLVFLCLGPDTGAREVDDDDDDDGDADGVEDSLLVLQIMRRRMLSGRFNALRLSCPFLAELARRMKA